MIQSQALYNRTRERVRQLEIRLRGGSTDEWVREDPVLKHAIPAALRHLIRVLEAEMQEFDRRRARRRPAPPRAIGPFAARRAEGAPQQDAPPVSGSKGGGLPDRMGRPH